MGPSVLSATESQASAIWLDEGMSVIRIQCNSDKSVHIHTANWVLFSTSQAQWFIQQLLDRLPEIFPGWCLIALPVQRPTRSVVLVAIVRALVGLECFLQDPPVRRTSQIRFQGKVE